MIRASALLSVLALLAACGGGETGVPSSPPPPGDEAPNRKPVEESDLYRVEGRFLYVQNPHTGLHVIDLSDPAAPELLGSAPITGRAGELYLHQGHAIVLFKSAGAGCEALPGGSGGTWLADAEIAIVNVRRPTAPRVLGRYCVPGSLVTSRMVGDFLFAVTNRTDGSIGARAISLDLAVPADPWVIRELELEGASREIHLSDQALFVASSVGTRSTRVQYVEISGIDGWMLPRGSIEVAGLPQGRFHLDAKGPHFRIVTYEADRRASRLSVIDVRDPDRLRLVGSLAGIGPGERLFATRFDGDLAYVVTFRSTDPLWVVSLADPAWPVLVGELRVPGWSDFIFPRGDRLLAVGRGDRGRGVQVSLFDVSDPAHPLALSQVVFGDGQTSSEANFDHRAVTVLEQAGAVPLVVVPYSGRYAGGCARDVVQLLDLERQGLRVRGTIEQRGLVRRTFAAATTLLSISDSEILALDVADRDHPEASGTVSVASCEVVTEATGQSDAPAGTQPAPDGPANPRPRLRMFCQSTDGAPAALPLLLVLGALILARRRRRATP